MFGETKQSNVFRVNKREREREMKICLLEHLPSRKPLFVEQHKNAKLSRKGKKVETVAKNCVCRKVHLNHNSLKVASYVRGGGEKNSGLPVAGNKKVNCLLQKSSSKKEANKLESKKIEFD